MGYMREVELIADWLNDLSRSIHRAVENLAPEELAWQPDAEANNIGVTVWHVSRWLDISNIRILQDRPADEEQWQTRGWAKKTGYNPRGIGYEGLGAVTGYTQDEVKVIPVLTAADQLAYFDQVCEALRVRFLSVSEEELNRPVTAFGTKPRTRSVYAWTKGIMQGSFGHVGEIFAIRAMYKRLQPASIQ